MHKQLKQIITTTVKAWNIPLGPDALITGEQNEEDVCNRSTGVFDGSICRANQYGLPRQLPNG